MNEHVRSTVHGALRHHADLESAFANEPPTVVREGQSFRDRPIVPHVLFRNVDASKPLDFVIAYVVRVGDPVVETP